MDEYLKYGDLISISFKENNFLYSKGFIDSSIFISDTITNDFYKSIFRVFPQTIHSVQSELLSLSSSIRPSQLKDTILRLKESAEGEIKTNIQVYSKFEKQPVKFGTLIQLQHLASGKFLSIVPKKHAEIEKDNIQVTLTDFFSDNSLIRVNPVYKFQKDGDGLIKFGDQVYLEITLPDTNKATYVHVSTIYLNKRITEINASIDSKSKLRIGLFTYPQRGNDLLSGDFIWLTHSELHTSIIKKGKQLEFSDSINDTNGLWKIEGENQTVGELLKTNSAYRIKNLSSGKYLTIKTEYRKGKTKEKVTLSNKKDIYSLWKFVHIYKKKKHLEKDDLCMVVNCELGGLLDGVPEKKFPILNNKSSETAFFKIFKCEESLIRQSIFLQNCQDPLNAFLEFLINYETHKVPEKNKEVTKICKDVNTTLDDLEKYCNNKLYGMIDFQKQFGQIQAQRQKILKEQKFIELFSEILKQINIEYIMGKIQDNGNEGTYCRFIHEIMSKIYNLLIVICNKNLENQKFAFSLIEAYKPHINMLEVVTNLILTILENNHSLLYSLSKPENSLIDHYTWLLRVNFSVRKAHFLTFLQSICVYMDSGIKSTQEKIHDNLFGNTETFSKAIISTISDSHSLRIILPSTEGESAVLLDDCFQSGLVDESNSISVHYFNKMLDLFADMNKNRNYTCKASLKDWFPVQILINYIWKTHLTPEIRASFVRLVLNMYIDSHPRHEEKFPEAVKVLNLQNRINEVVKYKIAFSLIDLETSVANIYQNSKRFTVAKKNRDSFTPTDVFFEGDELVLFRLKENLLDYLKNLEECPEFNVLSFEIIVLASNLLRFQVITSALSVPESNQAIINYHDQKFNYKDLDIARLISSLLSFLFFHQNKLESGKKTSLFDLEKIKKKGKNEAYEITNPAFQENEANPMVESLKHTKNYLKSVVETKETDDGYLNKCKIEICKLLEYVLDWRLDFLLNNLIEWFNQGGNVQNTSDYWHLIPDLPSSLFSQKPSKFKLFVEPEIKPLNFYGPNTILNLLKQFIQSQDYELRSLLLSVLFKSFSMRKLMFKHIANIQVLTTIPSSELFLWVKERVTVIKQLSEQSELWLNYWNQNDSLKEINFEKIKVLQNTMNEICDSLDFNARVEDDELIRGNSGNVSQNRQSTYFNINLHGFLIELIQDSMQSLTTVTVSGATQAQRQAKFVFYSLFTTCYKLLSRLALNNKKIQNFFHKHLDLFLAYIHLPIGQIELICNIFEGNKKLCKTINEDFLKIFTDLINKYGRQAEFLEVFSRIQVIGDTFLAENQRIVVKTLLEGDFSHVCYMQNNRFTFEINQATKNENYKDEPYLYHAKLIEIFSQSSYGSSGVYLTEIKCQKLLSIEYLFELLSKKDLPGLNLLYLPLLSFFFHVYIDTEKINENVINHPDLKKFLQRQAGFLRSRKNFTDEDIKEIEYMVEIIFKYNSLYCVGDIFDSTFEDINSYLSALLLKFELIIEYKINPKIIDQIELLGGRYEIDFPPTIVTDFTIHANNQRPSENIVRNTWEEFKDNFLYSDALKKCLKAENNELIANVISMSTQPEELNTSALLFAMLDYLNNCIYHKPKISLLNKLVKFLTRFLQYKRSKPEEIAAYKTSLNEKGIVRIIMSLLCDHNTVQKTFLHLLTLSIELLEDGNFPIQMSFFTQFSTNASSQVLFSKLTNFLVNFSSNLKVTYSKKVPIYKSRVSACNIVLRYLQLLCEGHNEKLQNYLRFQFKSRRNFNLITTLIFLLEELLKKSYDHHFLVISQCFDTLTEVIQGPCKQNQIEIIDSKFLEIVSRLLSYDEKYDNMSKYKILKEDTHSTTGSRDAFSANCLKGWMVAHLKYKGMITLISCLEGQTGNYVITRMIRSLSIEVLKENIISFFKSYTEAYPPHYYDQDLFEHHQENEDFDPDDPECPQENNSAYYQNIIEVGFFVYHLMCYFKDNNDPDNKRIVKNELPDLLLNENTDKIFGTKLIGDLGKLGLGLLKTGFSMVNNIMKIKVGEKAPEEDFDKEKTLTEAYAFFQEHTGNIEIIFQDDIFRIYFWIRPEGHFLTDDQKENFHFYVNRTSDKAKIQYLLVKSDNLIEEMTHQFKLSKLFNKYKLVALIASNGYIWKEVAFLMTLALNLIIILSFYNVNNNLPGTPAFDYDSNNESITFTLINVFGVIQMSCSACVVAFFLVQTAPVLIARRWRNHKQKSVPSNFFLRLFQKIKNGLLNIIFAIATVDVLYQLGYLTFSILGTGFNPLFFSFHLLDIMYRYPALQNVIRSVTIPRKSIFMSMLLILVICYLYSILGFLLFYTDVDAQCDIMDECFKLLFDQGLKCGGGIGDFISNVLDNGQYTADSKYGRLFWDATFYICITVIMLNVIQGIIVDTFARLREENDQNTSDRENKCFICSLDKEYIEFHTNRSFMFHTTYEHNEWNYIMFINYLKLKDPNERTGMESFLIDLIEKGDTSWIPQHRSLTIKANTEESGDLLKKKVMHVGEIYNILEREMKEIKKYFAQYLESKHIMQ